MDIIKGQNLVKADGSSVAADAALGGKKIVLIYFSAHWCPPCRAFTPMLKDFYEVGIYKINWYLKKSLTVSFIVLGGRRRRCGNYLCVI